MLVDEHADEDNATGNGIAEGRGVSEEVYHVAEHDENGGSDEDAGDGPFPAAQAAAAQDGRGDGVELKEGTVGGSLHGAGVDAEGDGGEGGAKASNEVGHGDDEAGVDAGEFGGELVAACGKDVAAEDGAVENDGGDDRDDDEVDEGHRNAVQDALLVFADENISEAAVSELAGEGEILGGVADVDGGVIGVEAGEAAVGEQAAEGDDEGLQLELSD